MNTSPSRSQSRRKQHKTDDDDDEFDGGGGGGNGNNDGNDNDDDDDDVEVTDGMYEEIKQKMVSLSKKLQQLKVKADKKVTSATVAATKPIASAASTLRSYNPIATHGYSSDYTVGRYSATGTGTGARSGRTNHPVAYQSQRPLTYSEYDHDSSNYYNNNYNNTPQHQKTKTGIRSRTQRI